MKRDYKGRVIEVRLEEGARDHSLFVDGTPVVPVARPPMTPEELFELGEEYIDGGIIEIVGGDPRS